MGVLPPNVIELSDGYQESWPSAKRQYATVKFGPVGERKHLSLPRPLAMRGKTDEEFQEWLDAGSTEANAVKAGWGSIYTRERAMMHQRLVRQVVAMVNASVKRGEVAADPRDPDRLVFW